MSSEAATIATPPKRGIFSLLRAAVAGEQKDFTTGSLNLSLFMLAVPMVLEMLMESLFAVVDAFYVSRVGIDALTTVALTEAVMMLVYSIAIGLSMSATAFVARRTEVATDETIAIERVETELVDVDAPRQDDRRDETYGEHHERHANIRAGSLEPPVGSAILLDDQVDHIRHRQQDTGDEDERRNASQHFFRGGGCAFGSAAGRP